jgi:copper(I)-binding protein
MSRFLQIQQARQVIPMGSRNPLKEGRGFELVLLFEVSGPRKVTIAVRTP